MIAIADNLNTRNKTYMESIRIKDRKSIAGMLKKLKDSGADMINLQCSLDGSGDEDNLSWITEIASEITESVSLDSRNTSALKKALKNVKNHL